MTAEQEREDVADQRQRWKQPIAVVHPSRLVFLDESGARTNRTRLYARAPRGQCVIEHALAGHWCTTTMLGALRWNRFEAPVVIEGAMDSVVFRGYVERMLVSTLHPNDVVVMDNLSSHKTLGVQEAIEAAGATVRYRQRTTTTKNIPLHTIFSQIGPPTLCRTHRHLPATIDCCDHRQRSHPETVAALAEQIDLRTAVVLNEQNIFAIATALNNAVRRIRNDGSGHARHADNLGVAGRKANN